MEWIKVTDRLPERMINGKNHYQIPCLVNKKYSYKVASDTHEFFQIQILVFNHEEHCWDQEDGDDYDCEVNQVTHWMPLPEPPTE